MSIRNRRHKQEVPELDITAFLNLMVVLIPFLLVSAVFTQITVIELNMPPPSDDPQQEKDKQEKLDLEIIIRSATIEIHAGKQGLLQVFKMEDGTFDYSEISLLLQKVKTRNAQETASMILVEPEINYDTLVQVMDTVRLFEMEENGGLIQAELFPDLSIGDAPVLKKGK